MSHYHLQAQDEILLSWQRSKNYDVDPLNAISPVLSRKALNDRIKVNQELLQIAKPYINKLYQIVEGTGFRVMLSDTLGCVLHCIGDDVLVGELAEPVPGTIYSEDVIGTNSIGTCIAINAPIQVWAEEHFCQHYQVLAGSTAPIKDKYGNLVGTITLAGNKSEVHAHTLGMSIAVADAISRALQIDVLYQEKQRLLDEKNAIFQTISEGLLVVDPYGVINECNSAFCDFFAISREQLLAKRLSDLPTLKQLDNLIYKDYDISNVELSIPIKSSFISMYLCIKRLSDVGGRKAGSIISVRTTQTVNQLVHKVISAKAYYSLADFVGKSADTAHIKDLTRRAADCRDNVLITGESGTGKEVIAHAIHTHSGRRNGPFIAINCGGVASNAISEELFGIAAENNLDGKPGKIELAEGGTLFLDDISNMSLEMQNVVQRVVEDKVVSRQGSNELRKVDVRIIAASGDVIQEKLSNGLFRSDLYYRLSAISIYLPPVRERQDDIDSIINHLLSKLTSTASNLDLAPDVRDTLINYEWKGNVREIENVLRTMVNNAGGSILKYGDLPQYIRNSRSVNESRRFNYIDTKEKSLIVDMLRSKKGNIRQAAIELGIARSTLYEKMKKYDIKK
ncbi:sigma 54-interacting transcriptional regulator [Vibrio hannami]|uniref:sigma-54-dependent Fis family transcriptional regulator n=1 Tax=Vibrio hannami TaxID=2717094 RepID=UPI00240ED310|nr:sigma 54-interacting transcriptional regulator [Vibrio hannami]MDG3085557.1 sigma 54-interacting transcriptional regulator [Vibrio hannami]